MSYPNQMPTTPSASGPQGYDQATQEIPTANMTPNPPAMPAQQSTPQRKANTVLLIVGAVLYVLFLTGVFLFLQPITGTGWVSLVFVTIAFALTFITPAVIKARATTEAVFFGIPIMVFGSYYFFAELVLGLIFLGFQLTVPFSVAFFLQLVLLAVAVVIILVGGTAQRASMERSNAYHMEAQNWNAQTIDVRTLLDTQRQQGASPQLIAAYDHLAETIQYSDPFTRQVPAVQAIEQRIAAASAQLQQASASHDERLQLQLIGQLETMYTQRSRTLMQFK